MIRELSIKELCEALDIHDTTARKYIRSGMPCDQKGRSYRFDADECASWMREKKLTGKVGRVPQEVSEELKKAQLRKLNAMADRYELELAKAKDKVVDKAEAERKNVEKFNIIRGKLLGLSVLLAPILETRSAAEVEATIERYVRDVLKELASS